jgi:hypothetical protein
MIEGSGSGSKPLTNGSGSGKPKNMWIRWIRIRIRTRNTGTYNADRYQILSLTVDLEATNNDFCFRMMDSLLKAPSTVMQLAYLGITELEIRQDSNKHRTIIFTSG